MEIRCTSKMIPVCEKEGWLLVFSHCWAWGRSVGLGVLLGRCFGVVAMTENGVGWHWIYVYFI